MPERLQKQIENRASGSPHTVSEVTDLTKYFNSLCNAHIDILSGI